MPHTRPQEEEVHGPRNSNGHNALSVRQLAHELNSMLDGSLRYIRLAEGDLNRVPASDAAAIDQAIHRLRTARETMNDMATILGRAMLDPERGARVLGSRRSLGEEARRIRDSLAPRAARFEIEITLSVSPKAAQAPASLLGPVLMNGLKNAIDACTVDGLVERHVEMALAVDDPTDNLVITITDTGEGIREDSSPDAPKKPGGNGLGLGVCREIVTELSGTFELASRAEYPGAVMRATIPLRSLGPA